MLYLVYLSKDTKMNIDYWFFYRYDKDLNLMLHNARVLLFDTQLLLKAHKKVPETHI